MKQHNNNKLWWILLSVLIIGTIVGIIWLAEGNRSSDSSGTDVGDAAIVADDEQTKGPADAAVTLIEYSDFQCPFCRNFYNYAKIALRDNPDVRSVYRHYPLTSIHPRADLAARASEAAGLQGKFWEMHDVLFDEQDQWSKMNASTAEGQFIQYAADLGLDVAQFTSDLSNSVVRARVQAGIASARAIGATGTPTLILNGEKINIPRSAAELSQILRDAKDQ
jgi:protein-disulfide isomerase